jgi:homoserine kinase
MKDSEFVTAFAPASIGNVGVGYDMLGLAVKGAGDRVSARRIDAPGIVIKEVRGLDGEIHPGLSVDAAQNTASLAAEALWRDAGASGGVELIVHKGIPLQSGMGSSAASAVAGAVAVNALLDKPFAIEALLPYAMIGEKFASGGLHADNIAPSLVGGLVLCPTVLLPSITRLPVPAGVCSVLLHPDLEVNTAESRSGLASNYSMGQWLEQQGYLAGFIAGCASNDLDLIGRSLRDVVIEPQRAASVPCFAAVKTAALEANALGCSLSGSGPSIFALCSAAAATDIADAMAQSCRHAGYECQSWISALDAPGAAVEIPA